MQLTGQSHPQNQGMKVVPSHVDIDVSKDKRWSVAALGVPLQWVGLLLLQTVSVTLYLEHRFGKVEASIERFTEERHEIYRQGDAGRDLALRDDRISELGRRIAILEAHMDHAR